MPRLPAHRAHPDDHLLCNLEAVLPKYTILEFAKGGTYATMRAASATSRGLLFVQGHAGGRTAQDVVRAYDWMLVNEPHEFEPGATLWLMDGGGVTDKKPRTKARIVGAVYDEQSYLLAPNAPW